MKTATLGSMVVGRHVDTLTLLDVYRFNLAKKVFQKDNGNGSKTYYQAENDVEDRFLRLSTLESFFLQLDRTKTETAEGAEGRLEHVQRFR